MKKLFKCTVCGLIFEAEEKPEKCPRCGAKKEMINELTGEAKDKIYAADVTNDIHAEIVALSGTIISLCEEGLEIGLDPACIDLFKKTKDSQWMIKQFSKAEIESHVKKEKW